MLELDFLYFGLTIGVIGKILLGLAVVNVHAHIIKERHIDADVLKSMRRERYFAILAIALMITGHLLEVLHYEYFFNF